ncbi:MAG: hypothetical protein ABFR50_11830 [Candidatus Fermentibacteria bacterium]
MSGLSAVYRQLFSKCSYPLSSRLLVFVIVIIPVLFLQLGCIDNFNIGVSGYVRNMADSSAVPGALLLMGGSSRTTSSSGFYEFGGYSTDHDETVELLLIATDVDGEDNGIFISKDTLIVLAGTQHIQDIILNIDIYVEIVGDGQSSTPADFGGE